MCTPAPTDPCPLAGRTPLHYAAYCGDDKLLGELVRTTDLNIDAQDAKVCFVPRLASNSGLFPAPHVDAARPPGTNAAVRMRCTRTF